MKRLTCFAIRDTFEGEIKERLLRKIVQFENKTTDNLEEMRYASDQMFKKCQIKRWNVVKVTSNN